MVIASIRDRVAQLRELDKRRTAIVASLEEQGKLTDELKSQIQAAASMTELEDLYLPYRPKRRTRAMIAKERGLEPLAQCLWAQDLQLDALAEAGKFLNPEQGVESVVEALAGARDIMAEWINEDQPDTRLIMQVHDELVLEARSSEVENVAEKVAELMSAAAQLAVKLKVDVGIGKNWDEAH